MIRISRNLFVPEREVSLQAVRSQGAGGQNVNKVATAIHLRFDILSSSLPIHYKQRLLKMKDSRIDKAGVINIKAQEFRTQERNKQAAINRLKELIQSAGMIQKKRIATKISKRTKRKRLDQKRRRGEVKSLRGKVAKD